MAAGSICGSLLDMNLTPSVIDLHIKTGWLEADTKVVTGFRFHWDKLSPLVLFFVISIRNLYCSYVALLLQESPEGISLLLVLCSLNLTMVKVKRTPPFHSTYAGYPQYWQVT